MKLSLPCIALIALFLFGTCFYAKAQKGDDLSKIIPQDTFALDFNKNGSFYKTLHFKYLEYKIEDAPQILFSIAPLGIWVASGDAGFGPTFGLNYRPIKQVDISAGVMVPWFHFYGKSAPNDPAKKRFFAAEIYPEIFFLTRHRVKESKFKLTGTVYGYNYQEVLVMDLPKVRYRQLGVRPGYSYWQGNVYEKHGSSHYQSFQSHIVSGGLVYRRVRHHVFGIRGYGYRIASSQLDIFADFMFGASLSATNFNTGERYHPAFLSDRMGGRGGVEYRFGVAHSFPLYIKARLEGGYAPSLYSKFYMQLGVSAALGIDKLYRNNYK